jgi:RND family efflux transporter MFP subunit
MLKSITKVLLPLLVLALAIGGAVMLVKNRPKPQKQERPVQAYLVQTTQAQKKNHRIDVRAQGTVEAARRIQIQAEISGRLTRVSDELVPGGLLKQGDLLARIDGTDYRINLEESQTGLEEAKARLEQERGQQIIAERELELFNQSKTDGSTLNDSSLALRKPQLKIAQVSIDAAEARLKRARTNLSRTSLKAPFNALVLSESVEKGQLVSMQSNLATLVGTDAFWVRASVPMEQLSRIKIPGRNSREELGSEVTIEVDMGGSTHTRTGHVIRLLGELDQVGRMAQILIRVEDPLALEEGAGESMMPLLLGSYVQVLFAGSQERELVEVPRGAIHDGDQVWIYQSDDTLDVRTIEVVANFPTSVLVASGIEEGEELITSQIGTPVAGMMLRKQDPTAEATKTAAAGQGGAK